MKTPLPEGTHASTNPYYQPVEVPQQPLFEDLEKWKKEWQDMPEFVQNEMDAYATITVRFATKEDVEEFSKLIGQPLTEKSKSIWHPKMIRGVDSDKRYTDES